MMNFSMRRSSVSRLRAMQRRPRGKFARTWGSLTRPSIITSSRKSRFYWRLKTGNYVTCKAASTHCWQSPTLLRYHAFARRLRTRSTRRSVAGMVGTFCMTSRGTSKAQSANPWSRTEIDSSRPCVHCFKTASTVVICRIRISPYSRITSSRLLTVLRRGLNPQGAFRRRRSWKIRHHSSCAGQGPLFESIAKRPPLPRACHLPRNASQRRVEMPALPRLNCRGDN